MTKNIILLIPLIFFTSCLDQFTFKSEEIKPVLVVEGFISNVSYNDSASLPNDPRYFSIKLRYTSIVSNVYDQVIYDASVRLISDDGFHWNYTPEFTNSGFVYSLKTNDFKAEMGKKYKLQIVLSNSETYETDFIGLVENKPMGELFYEETEVTTVKYTTGEPEIVQVRGINLNIRVPESDTPANYRWDFLPYWIFVAPSPGPTSPIKTCYVSDLYYLRDFILKQNTKGGFVQTLAFIETDYNERIFFEFSLFVRQQVLSDESFQFWSEIKDQSNTGGLFDSPPYNVRTNIKPKGHDGQVFGFFNVIQENSQRWYFTPRELSYQIDTEIACPTAPTPPDANVCINCLAVSNGIPINQKPSWWR